MSRRRARTGPAESPAGDAGEIEPSSLLVEGAPPLLGTVAVVGFPNVGKSTLVNRLSATRSAVVFETPGVTRDRKEVVCEWSGKRLLLVDTGGVDVVDPSPLTRQVALQARQAVENADLVLFVVDARVGITPGDEEIADILRRSRKPVVVLANKLDDPSSDLAALEFHRLGLGEPVAISALHGYGTGDLLDRLVAELGERGSGRSEATDGGDSRGDPRPAERREVEPPERAHRRGTGHRLRDPGNDA